MKIFILGLPGSGKGTLGSLLSSHLPNYKYFSVGELLRNKANLDAHIAKTHKEGGLVNSDRIFEILDEEMKLEKFICDGTPRKKNEAQYIIDSEEWNKDPGLLIYLNIDSETARKRLYARGRFDDTASIIENRIKGFEEETLQSISLFRQINRLLELDGNLDPKVNLDIILSYMDKIK